MVADLGVSATPLAENADWVEHYVAVEENKGGDNGKQVEQEGSDHHRNVKKLRLKKHELPMKPADKIRHWMQVAEIAEYVFLVEFQ